MTRLSSKALRIIKTCNLYASCISSGISMAVVGPCLLDFQELVHTDTEHIAIIFTCRSAGYLAGSLLGGALFDLTEKKQFLMTVFNFLISISMFAVPWSRTVGMLAGWLVLSGFSMGALDTGLNVCCLNLWETGTEIGYVQMVATYSVKGPLHLTSVTGSYVTSSFWAALTISRFSSIFLAIKFSSLAVIVFDLIIYFAGAVVLQFLAASREWALWLATVLLGFGVASLFASVITWVERYITVSNKILGLFASGAAFGEMAIPYVIGYFLEKIPEVLSYVVTASCVLSIFLTVILYLILRNKQDKYVEKEGIPNVAFDANAAD
ncbi:Sodium-dependent glucose transporter 1 like protein [Argiope bruennichi]|uniref:Sodium-dependent glucose transporter 1 like protein n=1 Tax=Argiope bruennichi TaxID=94029 RepID=A0A8T0EF55_ARGBR|nr:Sodium-dependent glucose transporter 1 like protein [Argiope bruennichi]